MKTPLKNKIMKKRLMKKFIKYMKKNKNMNKRFMKKVIKYMKKNNIHLMNPMKKTKKKHNMLKIKSTMKNLLKREFIYLKMRNWY
jgi:hypothetical protein